MTVPRQIAAVMGGLIEWTTASMNEILRMGFVIQIVTQPMNIVEFGGRKDMTGRHDHASILIHRSNDVFL